MNNWVILEGSMIFLGPTTKRAEEMTCFTPFSVRGISLLPVYWPDFVHSVSPKSN